MADRKLILISNDDGIHTSGLRTLIDSVSHLGDVIVAAPTAPQSGKSSAITVMEPLRIYRREDYNGAKMYAISGTPVDCVKLAMHTIVPRRPDIVLAGINHGSNAGNSIIYSGTMGAVFEGCMTGIPSVGYSLLDHSLDADFSETIPYIKDITERVINHGLPKGVCLNVNFPANVPIKGAKVVRAALGHWTEEYRRYDDPTEHPFYMLTGTFVIEDPDPESTDIYWLDRQYASIVPARADQTATDELATITSLLN